MNKLITFLSPYKGCEAKNLEYSSDRGVVTGAMTNEPVMKYLSEKLSSEGEKLDRIIAIVSEKIRTEPVKCSDGTQTTAYEYFSDVSVRITGSSDIMIPVAEKSEMGELINDICSHISSDDVIYIDTTGGFRKITNMLQLLTKILRYKGISNPVSYYANLQEKRIETTEEFITLTELADGVNEFASTGRSDQLSRCLGNVTDRALSALLSSMQRFTDNIRLCNVDSLEDDLEMLKNALEAFESSECSNDTRVVVLRQLIPVIREKFFGSSLSSEIDYCRMIGWCLDNGLVQQALTVFTEKIALELFRREIISVDRAIYEEVSRNPGTMFSNVETELFYANMMSSPGVITSECDKIIKTLEDHFSYSSDMFRIQIKTDISTEKALADFYEFEKELKRECSRSSAGSALKKLRSSKSEKTRRIAKILVENKPDICNIGTYEKFVNVLKNDKKVIKQVLGFEGAAPDNDKQTYSKKFITAAEFEKSEKFTVSGFFHRKDISNKQIAEIMYGYLYVKTTRNRINHASGNETITPEQENLLRNHGYRLGNALSYSEVSDNIRRALETVSHL